MAKMSEETKNKLIELRKKKMARANLKSLEHALALVAMDAVQEQVDDHVLPPVRLTYRECAVGDPPVDVQRRSKTAGFSYDARARIVRARGGMMGDACKWVRLKLCPEWITVALSERFGKRIITRVSYRSPQDPRHVENLPLFPVAVTFAFLKFVWPDPLDFGERVERYVEGYTDEYVNRYAGVGARIEVRPWAGTPDAVTVLTVRHSNWRPWKVKRENGEEFTLPKDAWCKNVG